MLQFYYDFPIRHFDFTICIKNNTIFCKYFVIKVNKRTNKRSPKQPKKLAD